MNKQIQSLINEQLKVISPTSQEILELKSFTQEVIKQINSKIKKNKVKAEVFIGGSFAKKTIIKKNKYDIDLFIRFDKKYSEKELQVFLKKIIPSNSDKLHGSRDYYRLKVNNKLEFEIIPVVKVVKASEARNITDLSYFHVNYITKAISRNKKLADEIKIAKAFTHYQDCYGAESYIRGFSGYALEILVAYYGSFENFVKAIAKLEPGKRIYLDPVKHYKNTQDIMIKMNESKLSSPIILIDPTFSDRNALAGLSVECLNKFRLACISFLKNPSKDFFVSKNKELDFKRKYGERIIELQVLSNKQAGDIAGTKIRKFYEYFVKQISRYFLIIDSDFVYDEHQNKGKLLFVLEKKDKIEFRGPKISMKEQLELFKREHKKIVIKSGIAWAYENNYSSFSEFLKFFKNKYGGVIASMDIVL